jgi:hypothetical protein
LGESPDYPPAASLIEQTVSEELAAVDSDGAADALHLPGGIWNSLSQTGIVMPVDL